MIRPFLLGLAVWLLLTWAIVVGALAWALLSAFIVPPAAAVAPWEWRPASGPFVSLGRATKEPPRPADETPGRLSVRPATTTVRPAPGHRSPLPPTATGIASFVGPGYGPRYLALPGGRGITVLICGRSACIVRVSTDAGPDRAMQRAGRVADLSWWDWQTVTACRQPVGWRR